MINAGYLEEPDDGYIVLGIEDTDSGSTIELQRSLDEHGLNAVCVTSDNGGSVYGALERWSLDGTTLHLQFTDEATSVLGLDASLLHLPTENMSADALALAMEAIAGAVPHQ